MCPYGMLYDELMNDELSMFDVSRMECVLRVTNRYLVLYNVQSNVARLIHGLYLQQTNGSSWYGPGFVLCQQITRRCVEALSPHN